MSYYGSDEPEPYVGPCALCARPTDDVLCLACGMDAGFCPTHHRWFKDECSRCVETFEENVPPLDVLAEQGPDFPEVDAGVEQLIDALRRSLEVSP